MIPLNCVISWLQLRKWNNKKGDLSKQPATSHIMEPFYAKCMLHTLPGSALSFSFVFFRGWTVEVIDYQTPEDACSTWVQMNDKAWSNHSVPAPSHLFTHFSPSPSCLTRRLKMSDALYWLRLSVGYFLSVAVARTLFKRCAAFVSHGPFSSQPLGWTSAVYSDSVCLCPGKQLNTNNKNKYV